jgi:hypothetical protein
VKVTAGPKTEAEHVKMVSATEGWMLLYDGKHPTTVNGVATLSYGYSLRHYQHGAWTDAPLAFLKPSMAVSDLDARAPGEVWLTGFDTTNTNNRQYGFAAHLANDQWTSYIGPEIGADATLLQTVSELSPTDVWVGGSGLYHFDGAHWTKAPIQGVPANYLVTRIDQMTMLSPSEGWAFPQDVSNLGTETTEIPALRYVDGSWRWAPLQGAPTLIPLIRQFAPSSPTQGWALETQVVSANEQRSALLFYEAGAWGVVRQQS